ncbi:hypothetical protein WDW86_10240 [Bdellovibrionota bacterium FG-2]
MDTFEVGVDSRSACDYVSEQIKFLADEGTEVQFGVSPKARGYEFQCGSYINGRYAYLCWEPMSRFRKNMPYCRFEAHASHFATFSDLIKWLQPLWGDHIELLLLSPLKRLDCCVDLAIPPDTVNRCLRQKFGHKVRIISKKQNNSHYSGSKERDTKAYPKGLDPGEIDFTPDGGIVTDELGKVHGTRIEVVLRKRKLPIQCLSEVEELVDINPFSHMELTCPDPMIQVELPIKLRDKVRAFQWRCNEVGYQAARQEYNQDGNFSRTIGRFLAPLDVDLFAIWQRRMTRFLERPIERDTPPISADNYKGPDSTLMLSGYE